MSVPMSVMWIALAVWLLVLLCYWFKPSLTCVFKGHDWQDDRATLIPRPKRKCTRCGKQQYYLAGAGTRDRGWGRRLNPLSYKLKCTFKQKDISIWTSKFLKNCASL